MNRNIGSDAFQRANVGSGERLCRSRELHCDVPYLHSSPKGAFGIDLESFPASEYLAVAPRVTPIILSVNPSSRVIARKRRSSTRKLNDTPLEVFGGRYGDVLAAVTIKSRPNRAVEIQKYWSEFHSAVRLCREFLIVQTLQKPDVKLLKQI